MAVQKITLKFGRAVVWKMKLTVKNIERLLTRYKYVVKELDNIFFLTF